MNKESERHALPLELMPYLLQSHESFIAGLIGAYTGADATATARTEECQVLQQSADSLMDHIDWLRGQLKKKVQDWETLANTLCAVSEARNLQMQRAHDLETSMRTVEDAAARALNRQEERLCLHLGAEGLVKALDDLAELCVASHNQARAAEARTAAYQAFNVRVCENLARYGLLEPRDYASGLDYVTSNGAAGKAFQDVKALLMPKTVQLILAYWGQDLCPQPDLPSPPKEAPKKKLQKGKKKK